MTRRSTNNHPEVLVSPEDELIRQHYTLHIQKSGYVMIAEQRDKTRTRHYLHRLVTGVGPSARIKFVDGNRLNCRRDNLLVVPVKRSKAGGA